MEALQQLHAAGILHGDIHAGNLLLPATPSHRQQQHARPRCADFGVASLCADPGLQAMELQECREMLVDEQRRASPRPRLHGKPTVIRPRPLPCQAILFMDLGTHLAVTQLVRPLPAALGGQQMALRISRLAHADMWNF